MHLYYFFIIFHDNVLLEFSFILVGFPESWPSNSFEKPLYHYIKVHLTKPQPSHQIAQIITTNCAFNQPKLLIAPIPSLLKE